jgi:hypothetical protein
MTAEFLMLSGINFKKSKRIESGIGGKSYEWNGQFIVHGCDFLNLTESGGVADCSCV